MSGQPIILGANGFVGRALVQLLKTNGFSPQLLDLNPEAPTDLQVIKFDQTLESITDKAQPCDVMILLSGVSSDWAVLSDRKQAYKANVTCLDKILNGFSSLGGKHVIFASSEWVYSRNQKSELVADPRQNTSAYGRQKLIGEGIVQDFCETFGIKATILRFGIIWGNRLKGSAVEGLAQSCIHGDKKITVGNKQTARRFVHVDDICNAIFKSMTFAPSGTFDLQGADIICLEDIIRKTCQIIGRSLPLIEETAVAPDLRVLPISQVVGPPFNWHVGSFDDYLQQYVLEYLN